MTLPLVDDPSIADLVDDTGTGQDGTVVDKAVFEAIATAIDDALIAPGETQTPGETTTEVIEARGTLASLDDRLSGVINPDGVFIGVDQSAALIAEQVPRNLVGNDDFLIWSAGDTSAPDGWVLSGTGTYAIQRCGYALADSTQVGTIYCVRLTTTATAVLKSEVIKNVGAVVPSLRGRDIFAGMRVKANAASQARIRIVCGSNTIASAYVSVLNTEQFISVTGNLSAAIGLYDSLEVWIDVSAPGIIYASGITVGLGGVAPTDWIPCIKEFGERTLVLVGGGTLYARMYATFGRPTMILSLLAHSSSSSWVLASALRIGVYKENNATSVEMLTTKLGANKGGSGRCYEEKVPDADYRYRCFSGIAGLDWERIMVQVDTADAAVDPAVDVRYMTYRVPFLP